MFLQSLVRRFLPSPNSEQPEPLPDWSARPHRVLFLRDDRVGDMVASLEVMRAIAESSPSITLDVLASPSNAQLIRGLPWFGDVLVHRRGWIRSMRLRRELARRRYDAVIDGRMFVGSVSFQRTLLMRSTGARWRIGAAGREHGGVYNVPIPMPDLPHWIDYLVALAAPFGVAPDSRDWRPQLRVSESARAHAEQRWNEAGAGRPRVVVNISTGHPDRAWLEERWVAVLRRLRERLPSANVEVLGMPADIAIAQRIAESVRGRAPLLGLEDAIASVATADLVMTPDTAVSHIASAFQRPTLALMRKDQERLVPYRTRGRNVFGDDANKLTALAAAPVLAALDGLLEEMAPLWGLELRSR